MGADIGFVVRWWGALLLVGAAGFPLARWLFGTAAIEKIIPKHKIDRETQNIDLPRVAWWDGGYLFAKAIGMATVTYLVYLGAILKLVPFGMPSILVALGLVFIFGIILQLKWPRVDESIFRQLFQIVVLEAFFFGALLFWSWIKGHEPTIHGLEKFMDYGFTKSILNSTFFPAPDMWFAGGTINYYYFGHTVMALLTKLSGLDLGVTYNLMLASLFAFTLTMSFSLGYQLLYQMIHKDIAAKRWTSKFWIVMGALVTSFLVTMAGNMQTIYAFTKGYSGDEVVPFWTILWSWSELATKLPEGLERYWYANATRFIPFTIHEFPSYSFVVSDVHGHVLSLPFVLLAMALLIRLFSRREIRFGLFDISWWIPRLFYGLLVSVLLTTNALDGPIYFGLLTLLTFTFTNGEESWTWAWWKEKFLTLGVIGIVAGVASLPFLLNFNSFANGLAVNCPPGFLANSKFGPIIFEGTEKCQHSPFWMILVLWGFFLYCGTWLLGITKDTNSSEQNLLIRVLKVFFLYSVVLIIIPEFVYVKDIYPAHFRSNTMFKLGYQAFMMFSLVSGFMIFSFLKRGAPWIRMKQKSWPRHLAAGVFFLLLVPQLFLVSIYPYFSVRSYFNSLSEYLGIDGTKWLSAQYPDDTLAIGWLNTRLAFPYKPQSMPVIVEADGDSYTDYNRVSAFTGLPTIVGWAVHEWLWRGTYDVVAPRREEIRQIYESGDTQVIRGILEKYSVRYIIVGTIEMEKYPTINEAAIGELGTIVFLSGGTKIYDMDFTYPAAE